MVNAGSTLCSFFLLTLFLCSSMSLPTGCCFYQENLFWRGLSMGCNISGISLCSSVDPIHWRAPSLPFSDLDVFSDASHSFLPLPQSLEITEMKYLLCLPNFEFSFNEYLGRACFWLCWEKAPECSLNAQSFCSPGSILDTFDLSSASLKEYLEAVDWKS